VTTSSLSTVNTTQAAINNATSSLRSGPTNGSGGSSSGTSGLAGGLLAPATQTVAQVLTPAASAIAPVTNIAGGLSGGLLAPATQTVAQVLTPTITNLFGGPSGGGLLGALIAPAAQLLPSLAQSSPWLFAGPWPAQAADLGPNKAPATDRAFAGALPASAAPARPYQLAPPKDPTSLPSGAWNTSSWVGAVSRPFQATGFDTSTVPNPLSQSGGSSGAGFSTGIGLFFACVAALLLLFPRRSGRVLLPSPSWRPFAFVSLLERPG
jgi:hypothetical protein